MDDDIVSIGATQRWDRPNVSQAMSATNKSPLMAFTSRCRKTIIFARSIVAQQVPENKLVWSCSETPQKREQQLLDDVYDKPVID